MRGYVTDAIQIKINDKCLYVDKIKLLPSFLVTVSVSIDRLSSIEYCRTNPGFYLP
jgi:hypothetical protein